MNFTLVNRAQETKVKQFAAKLPASVNIQDVEPIEKEVGYRTILMVVDRSNIDSMLGAALWVSRVNFDQAVKVHSFHPLDQSYPTGSFEQVVVFGCYIPEPILLKHFTGTKHTKIFCYREMYAPSKNINDTSFMEVVRPCEDWYGAEQAMIDNSVAWNVNQQMVTQDRGTGIMCLKGIVRDVAMYTNFAHKGINTLKEQIKIHNVMVTLERAFSKPNIRAAILDLRLINDEDGYKMRLDQVRQTSKIHGGLHRFVVPGKGMGGAPTSHVLPTFSCTAAMSRDVMRMILPVKGACLTYEDVREYRIVRIVTEDRRHSLMLADLLKPFHVWEEGKTIVAIVPTAQAKGMQA